MSPKKSLYDMAQEMLKLSENLDEMDRDLTGHECQLIRISNLPLLKSIIETILSAYLSGNKGVLSDYIGLFGDILRDYI